MTDEPYDTTLRHKIDAMSDAVSYDNESFTVTAQGVPVAVILPYNEYAQLLAAAGVTA